MASLPGRDGVNEAGVEGVILNRADMRRSNRAAAVHILVLLPSMVTNTPT